MRILPEWVSTWTIGTTEKSCCGKKQGQEEMLKLLDKVCRIALAVFSAVIFPLFFQISFALGAIASMAYFAYTQGSDASVGTLKPFCGQGYMEFLSGRAFSPWVAHVVTTVFVAAHIRHDPHFFVPFCGLFVGWWAGEEVATAAFNLGQRATAWLEAPPANAHCPCHI